MVAAPVKSVVTKYINPLFDQGWALFAPVPQVNKKVYVSCLQGNKQWSAWQDPFANYLIKHQSNRFTANGKMILKLSTTLHYLYFQNEELFKQKKNISGDTTSGYYKVLKNEVEQELLHQYKPCKNIRLIVEYSNADCADKQTHYIYYP